LAGRSGLSILDVNCIVLAGGKSVRLGRNKMMEEVGGQNLLERVLSRLAYFNGDVIVVTAQDSALPEISKDLRFKVVRDILPGKGALGGLYSGLTFSNSLLNLVVACDMPFINVELFKLMIDQFEKYDAVVPLYRDTAQPLHAVYSRSCIPTMQYLIEQNRLSILELFPMINVHYVNSSEIEVLDPRHLGFFNINTESDLMLGRKIAEQEDTRSD
jgi:molybdenum cofactor guanylyltransferase